MEPKYKIGDIVRIDDNLSWKFIEEVLPTGEYRLRDGEIVSEHQITDIMDALPD
jgi:hypothetical protein